MTLNPVAGALPPLNPILVVGEQEVEELIRTARADLAKLSLELRALQHEADLSEREGSTASATRGADLAVAREFLGVAIESRMASRRAESVAEADRARSAAARRILDAQTQATTLVVAARESLLQALSDVTGSRDAASSQLRIITTAPVRPDPPHRVHTDRAPVVGPPPEPAPPSPSAAEIAFSPAVRVSSPIQGALSPQVPAAPPAPDVMPARARAMPTTNTPSLRSRFLHADVLLPLVAVLIVVVVLLAWLS